MENSNLIQTVYTSLIADHVDSGDLFAMIQSAANRFGTMGITGYLVLAHGRIFQALEGRADIVDPCIASIHRDRRHHSMEILLRRTILRRQCAGWHTRRVAEPHKDKVSLDFEKILSRSSDAAGILAAFEIYLVGEHKLAS